MSIILHIVNRDNYETESTNGYYKPASLLSEGFIHCSTIEQVVSTANLIFVNQKNLILLCIDENKIESELKYELPACVNDERFNSLFPHIYGPLNLSAVIRVIAFNPDANGKFELPAAILEN